MLQQRVLLGKFCLIYLELNKWIELDCKENVKRLPEAKMKVDEKSPEKERPASFPSLGRRNSW
jgi:hypothetical protein